MPTTPRGMRYPQGSDTPNIAQYFQNLATDVDTKVVRTAASQAGRNALTPYLGMPLTRTDVHTLEVMTGTAGTVSYVIAVPKQIDTPCDTAINTPDLTVGTTRGLHPAVSIAQPFGAGVAFQGEILAQVAVNLQSNSEILFSANADPNTAGVRHVRQANTGGVAEWRTVQAISRLDSGSSDSFTFQPIMRQPVGTSVVSNDSRTCFSVAKVWPKS